MTTALITGASSGLGFALAKNLASRHGHDIIITGRQPEKLQQSSQILTALTQRQVSAFRLDQSETASIDAAISSIRTLGALPSLLIATIGINTAHTSGFRKLHRTAYSDIQHSLMTNVANTLYLLMQCIPDMQKAGGGRIVLIGSQAYLHGLPGQVGYNVCKSALAGLHNTINREYRNIDSCLFDIGVIDNERNARFRDSLVKNPAVELLDEAIVAETIINEVLQSPSGFIRSIP